MKRLQRLHIAHLLCTNFWYFFFSSGDPKKNLLFGDPEISLSSPPLVLENGKWRSGQFWKIWVFQMWFIYSCSINCIYQISIFSSFLYWANVHNTRHAVRAILQIRCQRRCRSNLFVISSLSWSGNSDQNFSKAFVTFLFEGGERQNAGFHNFGKAFTSLHKQTFSRNTNVIINTTACIASTFAAAAKKVKGK